MSLGDVQRLRAFVLVLDLGSISAAASVLGYTQSAVSQQLAALEREVGTPLVDRSQRPLHATRAGANLRPHVERVLAALSGAEAAVGDLRGGTSRLRLAAFPSALSSFVPAAVRDLRRAHPQLVVQVLQLETYEAIEGVRGGDADLAVVHHMPGVAVPETAGLQRRRLLVDHLHVVLPQGHRLARRDAVSVTDLDAEPLILPRRDTPAGRFRSLVEHLCAQAGFAPRVIYELDDLPAAQAFVAAGIAIVPMHGLTLATLPPGATTRPLVERPAGSRTVEVLTPAAARTAIADDLLDRLAHAASAYAAPPLRAAQPSHSAPLEAIE
ncbi:MAG TPA: LysR family transcriptional regulator [Solirubrobacteraceae bacterium]|nr:LysR family transcriptional regulator [Solirubrobacteraceae bacterium]